MEWKSLSVNTRPASLFGVLIIALTGPAAAENINPYKLLDAAPQACAHDACTRHVCGCASSPLSRATDRWSGMTSRLEESGIKFEGELSQFYQGVASGGNEQQFRYGGHGEYDFDLDFGKICGWDGFTIELGS
jgi:carbohydrate-selective porin OprB